MAILKGILNVQKDTLDGYLLNVLVMRECINQHLVTSCLKLHNHRK